MLLVAWALGVAIAGSGICGITPLVRESAVLKKVDEALPAGADGLLKAFNNVVGTTFFPRYLEPFAPERIVPVGPARSGCSPTPTSSAPSSRWSRSRAPTPVAAASRAPGSSSPPTG